MCSSFLSVFVTHMAPIFNLALPAPPLMSLLFVAGGGVGVGGDGGVLQGAEGPLSLLLDNAPPIDASR